MFGIFRSRKEEKVAEVATGILEIIDFNAAQLGYRAKNGLPREFAQKELLLAAIIILKADNIILTKIAAVLNLDQLQIHNPRIFQAVFFPCRDVG